MKKTHHNIRIERRRKSDKKENENHSQNRWQTIERKICFCNLCNKQQINFEYHYMFECSFLSQKHKELVKRFLFFITNRYNVFTFMSCWQK